MLATPHDPPGSFAGPLAPDGRTIYLSSDKDRDTPRSRASESTAQAGLSSGGDRWNGTMRSSGASRSTDQGTTAALLWNVAGRNELAFVDLASGKQ